MKFFLITGASRCKVSFVLDLILFLLRTLPTTAACFRSLTQTKAIL